MAKQNESGEVALVIFDPFRKNAAFVNRRSVATGDAGGIRHLFCDHMLYCACGVIERVRLNFWICTEKIAALIESDGMGEDATEVCFLYAAGRDQVVNDA